MAQYFIYFQGKQVGPLNKQDLINYGINRDSFVWEVGTPEWKQASQIPDLADIIPPAPPVNGFYTPGAYPQYPNQEINNKKIVASILALIFTGLGIHYFYLGKITAGILTIVLSLVTCGIWSFVMLVQGIVMLTMDDNSFAQKYLNPNTTFPLF
ncbi:MAG: NINE protein [Muribaculaceae bacterium]